MRVIEAMQLPSSVRNSAIVCELSIDDAVDDDDATDAGAALELPRYYRQRISAHKWAGYTCRFNEVRQFQLGQSHRNLHVRLLKKSLAASRRGRPGSSSDGSDHLLSYIELPLSAIVLEAYSTGGSFRRAFQLRPPEDKGLPIHMGGTVVMEFHFCAAATAASAAVPADVDWDFCNDADALRRPEDAHPSRLSGAAVAASKPMLSPQPTPVVAAVAATNGAGEAPPSASRNGADDASVLLPPPPLTMATKLVVKENGTVVALADDAGRASDATGLRGVTTPAAGAVHGSQDTARGIGGGSAVPDTAHWHKFIQTDFPTRTLCDFCNGRLWRLTGFRCEACKYVCHRSCLRQCLRSSVCAMAAPAPTARAAGTVTTATGGEGSPATDTVMPQAPVRSVWRDARARTMNSDGPAADEHSDAEAFFEFGHGDDDEDGDEGERDAKSGRDHADDADSWRSVHDALEPAVAASFGMGARTVQRMTAAASRGSVRSSSRVASYDRTSRTGSVSADLFNADPEMDSWSSSMSASEAREHLAIETVRYDELTRLYYNLADDNYQKRRLHEDLERARARISQLNEMLQAHGDGGGRSPANPSDVRLPG